MAELREPEGSWFLDRFTAIRQPYPLPGNACDGVTLVATLGCTYETIDKGWDMLQHCDEIELQVRYMRLGWWGRARQRKGARVRLRAQDLLAALKDRTAALRECLLIGWLRPRCQEAVARFNLSEMEASTLTKWALLTGDFELVIERQDGVAKLCVKQQGNEHVDQGWSVQADGQERTVAEIRDTLAVLIAEVRERRRAAESLFTAPPPRR
jgi:hypothetical protein